MMPFAQQESLILIPQTPLVSQHYPHPYFTDKENEDQSSKVNCLR